MLFRNHFITHNFQKKKSGGAKDSAIFAFFFLLRKRAKPAPPPYLLPLLVQHPLATCRLYYSHVTVDPQKSIDHVQRNRNKKVIYRSFVTNSYTNITTGSCMSHINRTLNPNPHSSDYGTVYTFVASQSLHNTQISKKKIRRSKRQRKFCLFFFCFVRELNPHPLLNFSL